MPTISVIIPTYNYSNVLRCAIESVLLQTFEDFELIVVGDGCTDDSEDVVQSFDDPRVRWHNLPQNYGNQGPANRKGLEMASGKYIAYLGHDDLWLRDHLEIAVSALQETGKPFGATLRMEIGPEEKGWSYIDHIGVMGFQLTRHITPGQLIHQREMGLQARWLSLHEMLDVKAKNTEMTFMRDLNHLAGADGFAAIQKLTTLKFAAIWRKDVYKKRPSHEQEHYLERIRTEPDVRQALLMENLQRAQQGLFYKPLNRTTGTETPLEHWGLIRHWQGLTNEEGTVAYASESATYEVFEGEPLFAEYTQRIDRLRIEKEAQLQKVRELRKVSNELRAQLEKLQSQQAALAQQAAATAQQLQDDKQNHQQEAEALRQDNDRLAKEIKAIHSTRAWQLVNRFWALKNRLSPARS